MNFAEADARRFRPLPERPLWRRVLLLASAAGAAAASQPWIRVKFENLFGHVLGAPAWQSSAGFTCLSTCALLAVMALSETHTRTTQRAVRPASMLLAAVMALALALHVARGPGMLRGVSATWTESMYLAAIATAVVTTACAMRLGARTPGR
ncbi:MAG TPA: hypothetical protein ENI87_03920 [bacterium]|nr:hypothetical protein [bacterium]